MNNTYEEFVEFVSKPGAKATIRLEWMIKGCPKCGCKKWEVTLDGWAYCMGCSKGFPTYNILTSHILEVFDFTEKDTK